MLKDRKRYTTANTNPKKTKVATVTTEKVDFRNIAWDKKGCYKRLKGAKFTKKMLKF